MANFRNLLLGLLTAAFCAAPAWASRAELDGMGLPRLLQVDISNVMALPASAGRLPAQVLFDQGETSAMFVGGEVVFTDGGRFALAMVGESVRFGYFLDGTTHNLILAKGAIGLTLGFTDSFDRSEVTATYDDQYLSTTSEAAKRTLRLALGWQHLTDSGRVYEIGVGGSVIDASVENTYMNVTETSEVHRSIAWETSGARGLDVTWRTTAPGPGFRASLGFHYEDLNPQITLLPEDQQLPSDVGPTQKDASFALGWQFQRKHLDRVVGGILGTWSDAKSLETSSSQLIIERTMTLYRGGVFVSLERQVIQRLVLRGGVQGLVSFEINEGEREVRTDVSESTRNEEGVIESPAFFLGASWSWKAIHMDARLDDDLNISDPFVRWAVYVPF